MTCSGAEQVIVGQRPDCIFAPFLLHYSSVFESQFDPLNIYGNMFIFAHRSELVLFFFPLTKTLQILQAGLTCPQLKYKKNSARLD